jgi:hypothetical protein
LGVPSINRRRNARKRKKHRKYKPRQMEDFILFSLLANEKSRENNNDPSLLKTGLLLLLPGKIIVTSLGRLNFS